MSFCFSIILKKQVLSGTLIKNFYREAALAVFCHNSVISPRTGWDLDNKIKVRSPSADLTIIFFGGFVKWYRTSLM